MATDAVCKPGYIGEKKKLLRDGHGVYVYENPYFRYEGTWKNGKKHGHGKLLMRDGTFYEGQFIDGEITGHGYKYFASTKARYTGQFLNGELEGYGIMTYADGTQYEGEWHQNRKRGMGVMKLSEGTYKGCFQGHLRHGQGSLMYENVYKTLRNGDYYKGYWVMDKRQGHGRLVCADGTIYEGQWYNDLFHGDGFMEHASGILYSGQWVNGLPERMAAKIVITNTTEIDIKQGETFSITVEVRDGADELVEDQGRELHIIAGYKYYAPLGSMEPALFDMIEDMEDKPISTPFGYDIVAYPLTDQLIEEEKPEEEADKEQPEKGDSEETVDGTDLTDSSKDLQEGEGQKNEQTEEEKEEAQKEDTAKKEEAAKKEDTAKKEEAAKKEDTAKKEEAAKKEDTAKKEPKSDAMDGKKEEEKKDGEKDADGSRPDSPSGSDAASESCHSKVELFGDIGDTAVRDPVVSKPLPPPVNNKRTGSGKCCWENLHLAPPPPMYRPFLVMEQVEKSKSKTKVSKDRSGEKIDSKSTGKGKQKNILTDEMYPRTGEYVIMVMDATNPPFLNHTLEPAFMLVKLRKLPVKKVIVKKASKPKWDTSSFIMQASRRLSSGSDG
ncbi:MORN repeat-containing protein 1-like isoform X2 [Gigantopelta aegis]|uniref:MORN repeat-containing protein 1-like isoform X2 n=1 Tax=Gigantopelta aegis TaxID=1735272 RepID=UPI001B889A36|nr:MORN repeat-containing protein 1-like isoform X2 [Gigantopelta aegis]